MGDGGPTDLLRLTRPDDWHVHFRDGDVLADTVPPIARVFGRAVAMPNTRPPVTNAAGALAYAARLRAAAGREGFVPLPSLYLTEHTTPDDIAAAKAAGVIAAKWYPAGATTNSDAGPSGVAAIAGAIGAMAEVGLVLQIHGEATDADCDVFEREARFVHRVLGPLCDWNPELRVVLEHATTAVAIAFVRSAGDNVAATITAHHLEVERGDLFRGGLRPHLYCLPLPKTRADRDAVREAAMSGERRFFLGSDSAPHPRSTKESACCPAGVYTGHHALVHYVEAFEAAGALDRLEAFASHHGADFYRLPRNGDTIALVREPTPVAARYPFGADEVVPYRAGEALAWRLFDP